VDPNRQFFSEGKAEESSALMALISLIQAGLFFTLIYTKRLTPMKVSSARHWLHETV
jgi:hypothetical protein